MRCPKCTPRYLMESSICFARRGFVHFCPGCGYSKVLPAKGTEPEFQELDKIRKTAARGRVLHGVWQDYLAD